MHIYENKTESAPIDRFTVILGKAYDNSVFAMSENANMPDGVNQFVCYENEIKAEDMGTEIGLSDCPKGVLIAIIRRIEQ